MGYFKEVLIEQTGNYLEIVPEVSACELTVEDLIAISEFEKDHFTLDIFEYSNKKTPTLTLIKS